MKRRFLHSAFSLVEMLTAVTVVGVLTALSLPNVVRVKEDSEQHLAISKAESLNLAMASLVQAKGVTAAATSWSGAATSQAKYALLTSYLAFAPTNVTDYVSGDYTLAFPSSVNPLQKVTLTKNSATISY